MYTHELLITLLKSCCMSDHYVRSNDECAHMCYCDHYLHHVVCQINMSDLMMNVHTYVTDNTTYTCCMSDLYIRFNDEYIHMSY